MTLFIHFYFYFCFLFSRHASSGPFPCETGTHKLRLHHYVLSSFVITIDREIRVPLAPQEKLAQLAPRVCQENPELKVSEDSRAQWSVTLFI